MGSTEEWRVHTWLKRNRLSDLELTPLVRARILARHRADRGAAVGFGMLFLIAIGIGFVAQVDDAGAAGTIAWFTAIYLLLYVAVVVMLWLQRRADLRIARGLPHRVTRSEATSPATLLGPGQVWSGAAVYSGGALLGAAVTGYAGADRGLGLAFLAGTVLFGGFAAWLLGEIARRPAVADDEVSLRADHRLRRVDASQALAPYPAILALVAGVNSRSAAMWLFLGYCALAFVAWLVPALRSSRAGAPEVSPA